MKFRNLLAMGMVVATGLTLASCGGNKVTVGLGYSDSWSDKDPIAVAVDQGQLDLTTAFAAFDSKGRVVDCRFDVVQVKVKTDYTTLAGEAAAGVVLTNNNLDASKSVTTKLELGDAYNMKGASAIGLEVDTQIEAFADWTIGRTVEEIKSTLDLTLGHGVAHHPDLAATCTISCNAFVEALECAYNNRTEETYKVSKSAKAGVAMVSGLAYNYGAPQTDISVDIAGVIVDEGVVVASQIDAVVFQLSVSKEVASLGEITAKQGKYYVDGNLTSKKDLGDAYAMAERNDGQAGCTLEWYEQAAVIEAAANGKTADQIATLKKAEGDLATATITLNSYVQALTKAAKYAVLADVA